MSVNLHVGLDDTDSPRCGCTTYVAALIIEKMRELGVSFIDYPALVRLNPNVPWKTRGNGALCLRITCRPRLLDKVKESVIEKVEEQADLSYEGTDPGIVFLAGDVPKEIESFTEQTITSLVEKDEALKLISKFRAEALGYKKGRGIIGGLAAIGSNLEKDHTYEFIAYRTEENRGTPRRVDAHSVVEMDRQMGHSVFSNIDSESGRVLITPRGPDPILYGIRGETPEAVKNGHEIVVAKEPIERWTIFKTNQGTDAHLKKAVSIKEVKPFNPVIVRGEVAENPHVIQGGHVIFEIADNTGRVDCAAYEPTGALHKAARNLIKGDLVEVYGGIRPSSPSNPMTVNLEKMHVTKMAPLMVCMNPLCPVCGKRTKSMGKDQGFECKKCGLHAKNLKKTTHKVERTLKPRLYLTSPRSQRHLTKPLQRYGLEKTGTQQKNSMVLPYEAFYGGRNG
jgi:tRNA(Ile2)-agmatinylcytidine synthase